MYDTIEVSQFAGLTMDAAAGYVDGHWPTFPTLGHHVPPGTKLVSISVLGNPADCIDVEPGDVNNSQGAAWARKRIDEGHWKPIVYTSASNATAMFNALGAVGVKRDQVRYWSAHYTTLHICSPSACGYPQADGTQWTDRAHGRNLDQSELEENFFQQAPVTPGPGSQEWWYENEMIQLEFGGNNAAAVVIPNYFADGNHRLRFGCSQGAQIKVDFLDMGATWTGNLDYGSKNEGVKIPKDCNFVVVRKVSASGPIAMCFTT
ncbi:MAG TPA: hypothetical protein VEC76_14060 [Streptosporangiaceae bacterium]|nr:hypothetical protein [Streptosporangiaceae bacterium]